MFFHSVSGPSCTCPREYKLTIRSEQVRHLPPWLPGNGNLRTALKFRETMHAVVNGPYEWSQAHKSEPSVAQSLCARFQDSGLDIDDKELAAWTAAVQFVGAFLVEFRPLFSHR